MADWQYILLKPAQKYLERMQREEQLRIINALDQLLIDREILDVKPLKGRPEMLLRVGKYRVLFIEDLKMNLYVVTTIGSRGDVYK